MIPDVVNELRKARKFVKDTLSNIFLVSERESIIEVSLCPQHERHI